MGMEMAIAYVGNLLISPLYGLFAKSLDLYEALPFLVLALACLMALSHEVINAKLKKRDASLSEEEKKEYATI